MNMMYVFCCTLPYTQPIKERILVETTTKRQFICIMLYECSHINTTFVLSYFSWMKKMHLQSTYLTGLGVKINNPAYRHSCTLIKLKVFGTVLYRVYIVLLSCIGIRLLAEVLSTQIMFWGSFCLFFYLFMFFCPFFCSLCLILFIFLGKVQCGDCYQRGLLLCSPNTTSLWSCEGIFQRLFSTDL